nr:uncharacterized protein LOC127337258 [Lolium perenne]
MASTSNSTAAASPSSPLRRRPPLPLTAASPSSPPRIRFPTPDPAAQPSTTSPSSTARSLPRVQRSPQLRRLNSIQWLPITTPSLPHRALAAVVLHAQAQLAPRGGLLPGVLHEAILPQQYSDVMRPGGLFPRPRWEQVHPRVAGEAPLLFSLPPLITPVLH